MDSKAVETELSSTIHEEDKQIIDLIEQYVNELQSNIDSEEEREANNNSVWYYSSGTGEIPASPSVSGWDHYYDSDCWSDYESFNKQVQLERMWNGIEQERDDHNWGDILGLDYWDDSTESSQQVYVQ